MSRQTLAALALSLLAACGGATPVELAKQADDALTAGNPAEAQKRAEQGQEAVKQGAQADRQTSWGLERVRLEAHAKQGHLAEVLAGLTTDSVAYADQLKADFYAKLARELADAGKSVESLELVEVGKKKFPDKAAAFDGLIAELKTKASSDDALTAKLKQLGYL